MDGFGEVHDVPISDIIRPLQSFPVEAKIESICATIEENPTEVPPITLDGRGRRLQGHSGEVLALAE